jgi:hypothetical protein
VMCAGTRGAAARWFSASLMYLPSLLGCFAKSCQTLPNHFVDDGKLNPVNE